MIHPKEKFEHFKELIKDHKVYEAGDIVGISRSTAYAWSFKYCEYRQNLLTDELLTNLINQGIKHRIIAADFGYERSAVTKRVNKLRLVGHRSGKFSQGSNQNNNQDDIVPSFIYENDGELLDF